MKEGYDWLLVRLAGFIGLLCVVVCCCRYAASFIGWKDVGGGLIRRNTMWPPGIALKLNLDQHIEFYKQAYTKPLFLFRHIKAKIGLGHSPD